MTPRSMRAVGTRERSTDKGIALILVLLAMLVLSVLAAGIVFSARSETFAGANYRLDTQADYAAKAGIETAVNWFRSNHYMPVSQSLANTDYVVTSNGGSPSLYTANQSPVRCKANCSSLNSTVQLIGYGNGSSNYPNNFNNGLGNAVSAAFATDLNGGGNGVRITGDANHAGLVWVNAYLLNYKTMSMTQNCAVSNAAPPCPLETWLITAKGVWTGSSSQSAVVATAEEQVIIHPVYTPSVGYGIYGYCSVTMSGSACTDSYNSSLGEYAGGNASAASTSCDSSNPDVYGTGGDVGADGYVNLSGGAEVYGDALIGDSNPSLIPSSCCTVSGGTKCGPPSSGHVTGSTVNDSSYVPAPAAPTFPAGFPTGAPSYSSTATIPQTTSGVAASGNITITAGTGNTYAQPCATGSTCNGSAANPYLISSINMSGSNSITLYGGTSANPVYYDVDSLTVSGGATMAVTGGTYDAITATWTGYIVLNVRTSMNVSGGGEANAFAHPPETMLLNFAGASATVSGNGGFSGVLTAPNATVTISGGGSNAYFLGSVAAYNVVDSGGALVHYDTALGGQGGSQGQVVVAYSRIKQ